MILSWPPDMLCLHIHPTFPLDVPRDVTDDILKYWLRTVIAIPAVNVLGQFLDQPLPEHAKIPVPQYRFDLLTSSSLQNIDRANKERIGKLFRISEDEHSEGLCALLTAAVANAPPDHNGTESAFHTFWDLNVRAILQWLIPNGVSIRDSNRNTNTAAQRPDFGFLYLNVCAFRGEEKSPSNNENPRAELSDKMTWTYDPAPYILGMQ